MLITEELKSRTYEERMGDVLQELPLLSSEWTNYNPSDPGITTLEYLTAFAALQGSEIATLSYRARMALLKMAGFVPNKGKCARVLLSAEETAEPVRVQAGQRLYVGSFCFETNREFMVGCGRVRGVYAKVNDEFRDLSYVLDREIQIPAEIFGDKPAAGDSVWFYVDDVKDVHRDAILYVEMDKRVNRNPMTDRSDNLFASLTWECWTDKGFEEIQVRDYTAAFLTSGEIRLRLPVERMVPCPEGPESDRFCIRATLNRAAYDIRPRITSVEGFLLETWQKETKSFCQIFSREDRVRVAKPLGNDVYYMVFAKEEKGSSYRKYELTPTGDQRGRFVLFEETPGDMRFTFDEERFGFAPQHKIKDPVRVVVYNEEIMRKYRVGRIIGYDDQEIELPVKRIVQDSFCLIARREDGEGGYLYDFVRPEKKGDDALYYHLLENDGRIIIEDPGAFIGAELFMCSVATTEGEKGNIRAGCQFSAKDDKNLPVFYNPGPGTGGMFRETFEQVRTRFVKDMHTPYAAVSAEDYEQLVLTTPGLCIRKAHAVMNEGENLVRIAVMPDTDEEHPILPPIYLKKIAERIEERRLITTRFKIMQPVYVPIYVRSTVYVKRHYKGSRERIEERIRTQIDDVHTDRNFGRILRFEDVFHAIEELDCVEYVFELSIRPENTKLAQVKDANIYPLDNCLCCPGEIQLELVTPSV